jgi:hypothetical protein
MAIIYIPSNSKSFHISDYIDKTQKVPVILYKDKKSENIILDIRNSTITEREFSGKFSFNYQIQGYLISKNALQEITINYEAHDESGNIIFSGIIFSDLPFKGSRPNDMLPFYTFKRIEEERLPKISRIIIKISDIKTKAALLNYPESVPIKTIKLFKKSTSETDLKLLERDSEIKYNSYSKAVLHSLTLEIENTGKTEIISIDSKIHWYDKNGKKISSYDYIILDSSYPPLKPADKSIFKAVLNTKKENAEVAAYEIEIIEIQTKK